MKNKQALRRQILLNILERGDANAVQAFIAESRRQAFANAAQPIRQPFFQRHPTALFFGTLLANAIVIGAVVAICCSIQ
jgi:hypothetical protein